jgi:C2H2-type zinc finger
MAQQEQPKQQIKCKQCGKVVNSQQELREHEKTHQAQGQQPGGQARGAGGGEGKKSGQ